MSEVENGTCPEHPDAAIGYTDPTGGDPWMGGPVTIQVCTACARQVFPRPPSSPSAPVRGE